MLACITYVIDVANASSISSARLELYALNDFDQIVTNATYVIFFARIPQPFQLQFAGSSRDTDVRVDVSWLNIADRLSFEISLSESFVSSKMFQIYVPPTSRSQQVTIPESYFKRTSFIFVRYTAHYLSLTSLESPVLAIEYHIVPKIMHTNPSLLTVSLEAPFTRITVAMSRPCCISGNALCALSSASQEMRIGSYSYSMLLDPNRYGVDYYISPIIAFIVTTPNVGGLATIQLSCDDGNSSLVIPVSVNNPVTLVAFFHSEVPQEGGSIIRCTLANMVILPSVMFANISGDVVTLRFVSHETKTLTVEFIAASSAVSGFQRIVLNIGNLRFPFSIVRTGNVHIVEFIPTKVTAGIRTSVRIVVRVLGCYQPELLVNGEMLPGTTVESSDVSVSSSIFVFSAYLDISIVGSANVTARFQCGISVLTSTAVISVVTAAIPTFTTATILRDNSLNRVSLVFSTPSTLNLETFVILPTAVQLRLSSSLESNTNQCAPECFFLLLLDVPLGLSSVTFTLVYSATGLNASRSISNVAAIRSSYEARILRVVPSVLYSRGGQLMFVSIAYASVHNFSLTSPAVVSSILCKIVAVVNMSKEYSRSDAYTQLSQML